MNKLYVFALSFISLVAYAQQGSPAMPYYNNFDFSQQGMALKNALASKITSTHTNLLNYQEAENAIMVADLEPGSNLNLLLVYGFSPDICPASSGNDNDHRRRNKFNDGAGSSCEWNREHTYAKSLGNPDLGESGPGADVHHIRASDVDRNGLRGNKKFAAGSGNSGNSGSGWYPGDEWKGDVARMMMYMYLRYGNQCLPKNVAIGNTVATDSNMPAILLQWNAEDPVSQYEDNRNNYLGNTANNYGQGNRNPFIDNPYLATKIWGGQSAQDRWGLLSTKEAFSAKLSVFPNPALNNEVFVYSEIPLDEIQLINFNGQVVLQILKPIAENEIYRLNNLPQGFYLLKLSGNNQTATRKVIVN